MTDKEFRALVKTYHAAKVAADKAKSLGEQIKAEMKRRGEEKLPVGDFIITVKSVDSTRFDVKAFESEHKAIYEKYLVPAHSERLYIK